MTTKEQEKLLAIEDEAIKALKTVHRLQNENRILLAAIQALRRCGGVAASR